MKKLLFSLMLLLNTNNAWSLDVIDLTKTQLNTDKFFKYCIQDIDNVPDYGFTYCLGFYNGVAQGWYLTRNFKKENKCQIPNYSDFSTKFNSLFYRKEIDTNISTIFNIYITLNELCDNQK